MENSNLTMFMFLLVGCLVCVGILMFCLVSISSSKIKTKKLKSLLSKEPVEGALSRLKKEQSAISQHIIKGAPALSSITKLYEDSRQQVASINLGINPPLFKFDDPEFLKRKIKRCHERQLALAIKGEATSSPRVFKVENSEERGRQLIEAFRLLLLGAFNEEFEVIRRQMRHNSFGTASGKLEKLEDTLNKMGEPFGVWVQDSYFRLKQEELEVWHEDLVRRQEEKEERKRQREELKAQGTDSSDDLVDELEIELKEKEEELERARQLAASMLEKEQKSMQKELNKLDKQIIALQEKQQRAISQAQITRSGFIYVISNIGSFGEGVCKIGMTRRLEPMDRVNELGDASVPFKFDVHTLVYVSDAPKIEKALHNAFNDKRVNVNNNRKEFFRVSPEEVEDKMTDMGIEANWYFDVEAKEYRESILMREALSSRKEAKKDLLSELPDSI